MDSLTSSHLKRRVANLFPKSHFYSNTISHERKTLSKEKNIRINASGCKGKSAIDQMSGYTGHTHDKDTSRIGCSIGEGIILSLQGMVREELGGLHKHEGVRRFPA